MAVEMIMPKVDMDQETGKVVDWLKGEGDQVKKGEVILVIETDKIAIDVEAPESGILAGVTAAPGDEVPIGTVIAYILKEGESLPEDVEQAAEDSSEQEDPAAAPPETDSPAATPAARSMAADHDLDLSQVRSSGQGGKILKKDVQAALQQPSQVGPGGKVVATPSARRKARKAGISLDQVPGSGPGGRIQAFDVDNYLESAAASPSLSTPQPAAEAETLPLVGIRQTIAERMTSSYKTIPHVQFTNRADVSSFLAVREELNREAEDRGQEKISMTALLVSMVAGVLCDHPRLNSSLGDDQIVMHQEINVGVAVALEEGLIVPVVPQADQKTLRQLAKEVKELTSRARERTLTNQQVKGGTFTITNLGPFGVEQFNAIINPPEAAILAVGSIQPQPVVLPDGSLDSRPLMSLTLSADHRIIDGVVAAKFLSHLVRVIESPILMNY